MTNSKYSLLVLIFALCDVTVSAQQTLHLIYTANAYPSDSIYLGCQVDERNTEELFTEIGKVATENGHDLRVRHHRPDYDKQSLLQFLQGLTPAPDDAVVFMFSGHGLEDPDDGHWPLLYYCDEPDAGGFDFPRCGLSLRRVHELLRSTGVRMSLTVASSCNHDPLLEDHEQRVRSLEAGGGLEEAGGGSSYEFGLFTDFRGHILASASKAGQPAYLTDAEGSYYIRALLQSIIEGLVADNSSWPKILHHTDLRVREVFRKKQNAQFRIYAPAPSSVGTPSDLRQLAYLILEEGLVGAEDWSDAEQDNNLYRLYVFYDRFLAQHQTDYSEDAAYRHFVTALDAYESPGFATEYEDALTLFAYLTAAQQDEIDDFLYPTGQ
jgi:hypothetical protein